MFKYLCRLSVAIVAVTLSVANGCGPTARVIEGNVTLDGKPMAIGAIEFDPIDSSGRLLGADIVDGRYRIEAHQDQGPGKYIVRIQCPRPTGRKVAAGSPAPRGTMIEEIADAIPAQYNTKSTLKVDLSTAGPYNFQLASHP